jgi:methyl coenzyme M reductase alpha subunit
VQNPEDFDYPRDPKELFGGVRRAQMRAGDTGFGYLFSEITANQALGAEGSRRVLLGAGRRIGRLFGFAVKQSCGATSRHN